MGRRAIHLTRASKKAAQKDSARRHATSDCGKATRSKRNSSDYTARKKAKCTFAGVELPSDMVKRSGPLLEIAYSFHGGEDYSLGLLSSPYMLIGPDSTVRKELCREEHGRWVTRRTRLSAVQYHAFVSTAEARAEAWKCDTLDIGAVQSSVRDEIEARRHAWIAARDNGFESGDGQLQYVLDVYLGWGAKLAVALGQEWEIRARGVETYVAAYEERQLPWQRVMHCMRLMLAK